MSGFCLGLGDPNGFVFAVSGGGGGGRDRVAFALDALEDFLATARWGEGQDSWKWVRMSATGHFQTSLPQTRHMNNISRERVLELWVKLSEGRIDEVEKEPWLPGYYDAV